MPKKDIDLPDWSKVSTVCSTASHALAEFKQMSNQVASQHDMNLPDWSKLSGAVLSRASDALVEVKQLSHQAMSEKDLGLPNINWSKASGDILSRASDALTDAGQVLNQAMSQKNTGPPNIDWSRLSGNILSHASNALTDARQLVNQASMYRNWSPTMLQPYQEKLWRFIMNSGRFGVHWSEAWATVLSCPSKLWDAILSGPSKLWSIILWGPTKLWGAIIWGPSKSLGTVPSDTSNLRSTTRLVLSTSNFNLCTVLSCASRGLTGLNIWSMRHPYVAAGVLLYISEKPDILLIPLQLMGKRYTRTSAVPLNSGYYETADANGYEKVDAHKTESMAVLSVSWSMGLGAVFVLGRTWGWWD